MADLEWFPFFPHCPTRVFDTCGIVQITRKGRRLRPIGTPKTTFSTLLSPSPRPNRSSIDKVPKLSFSLLFPFHLGRRRNSKCPHRAYPENTRASVCNLASRQRPASFSFLFLYSFPLFLPCHPSSFLCIGPLRADTTTRSFRIEPSNTRPLPTIYWELSVLSSTW